MINEVSRHRIIFVGGIHGVGKTTLCEYLCSELKLSHYSASELITRLKKIEFPKNKHIVNIEGNQDSLITAINEYMSLGEVSLLDGHFCLLNENGEIAKIPSKTFSAMSPIAIVGLYDDYKEIYARLRGRDKHDHSLDLIKRFQDEEISYSESVASNLKVPYIKANPLSEKKQILEFVSRML